MCHVEDKIKAPIETIRLEKFLIELNFSNSIVSKLEITFSIIIFDMIDEKKKYPSLFWKMQVVRYETKCYWRGKKKKEEEFLDACSLHGSWNTLCTLAPYFSVDLC